MCNSIIFQFSRLFHCLLELKQQKEHKNSCWALQQPSTLLPCCCVVVAVFRNFTLERAEDSWSHPSHPRLILWGFRDSLPAKWLVTLNVDSLNHIHNRIHLLLLILLQWEREIKWFVIEHTTQTQECCFPPSCGKLHTHPRKHSVWHVEIINLCTAACANCVICERFNFFSLLGWKVHFNRKFTQKRWNYLD